MIFTSILAVVSVLSTFIPFAIFFFPLNTSEIPPAKPPAIPATPCTSDTATPAITAITSVDISIPFSSSLTSSFIFCSFS